MIEGILTGAEIALADFVLECAAKAGAQDCRVTLTKGLMDLCGVLDGGIDKVSHSLDRSLVLALFADNKYGTFSTNRLEKEQLEAFVNKAIASVKLLEEDKFRKLPAPEMTMKDPGLNCSLEVCDLKAIEEITPEKRMELALSFAKTGRLELPQGYSLLSEEGEYSDTVADIYITDSKGTKCRQTDTAFEHGVEITICDAQGNKYSAYEWQAAPTMAGFKEQRADLDSDRALKMALEKAGALSIDSGKYTMMIDESCSGRLLSPVLKALGGMAIQQKNSFLLDCLGKKVFSENLSIMDCPLAKGKNGARLFDSEGVRTVNAPIIENGVVKQYFINTYIAGKTGLQPTVDDYSRAVVSPFEAEALPQEYILVTDFNGGNCNAVTGDFSYGVEGFIVRGDEKRPVKEMLITGNMIELWNKLIQAKGNSLPKYSNEIGCLVFKEVDFSGE